VPVVVSLHDYYAITPQHTMQDAPTGGDLQCCVFVSGHLVRDLTEYLNERRRSIERGLARASVCIVVF